MHILPCLFISHLWFFPSLLFIYWWWGKNDGINQTESLYWLCWNGVDSLPALLSFAVLRCTSTSHSKLPEPDLLMKHIRIFFICFFSVTSSFREWNSFCALSLLLHIYLLDYCSPETLNVYFFLCWWVQFVALVSPDAIILCPTHATLCFNFQTIALTCSILRSYVFIETLYLCLPLYM